MSDVEKAARDLAEKCVHVASDMLTMTTRSKDIWDGLYNAHSLSVLCNEFTRAAEELLDIDMEGYYEQ